METMQFIKSDNVRTSVDSSTAQIIWHESFKNRILKQCQDCSFQQNDNNNSKSNNEHVYDGNSSNSNNNHSNDNDNKNEHVNDGNMVQYVFCKSQATSM